MPCDGPGAWLNVGAASFFSSFLLFLRLRMKKTARRIKPRPARPPTTPPTIAPTGVLLGDESEELGPGIGVVRNGVCEVEDVSVEAEAGDERRVGLEAELNAAVRVVIVAVLPRFRLD